MNRNWLTVILGSKTWGLILAGAVIGMPISLLGQEPDQGVDWTLRWFGVVVDTEFNDYGHDGNGHRHRGDNSEGVGAGFSAEARFSPLVGLELTHMVAATDDHHISYHDDEFDYEYDVDGIFSLLLGVNFHVLRGPRVDFHLGPQIGIVLTDNGECRDREHDRCEHHDRYDDDEVDGSAVLGLNLGLDISLGRSKNWALYLAAKGVGGIGDDDHHHDHDRYDLDESDFSFVAIGASYSF